MYIFKLISLFSVYKSLCRSSNGSVTRELYSSRKMLLLIFCSIFVLNFSVANVEHFDKLGNFTIKSGNTTEIHFQIKDTNTKAVQSQLEEIR